MWRSPPDLRAFLSRGLRSARGGIDEPFASLGFDFVDAETIVEHTQRLRDAAGEGEEEHAQVIRNGVAVTYSEPVLVVTNDGVYHFSFRNPLLQIAPSWADFLDAWLASGCFGSHSFESLWAKVGSYAKCPIKPAQSSWVKAYKKQFPTID